MDFRYLGPNNAPWGEGAGEPQVFCIGPIQGYVSSWAADNPWFHGKMNEEPWEDLPVYSPNCTKKLRALAEVGRKAQGL